MQVYILVLVALLFAQSPNCQTLHYSVRQYASSNGLPQNSINDILLDRNNLLWLTTQGGFCRFDGEHFLTYNISNTPILRSNRFYNFLTEPGGGMIILDNLFTFYALHTDMGLGLAKATKTFSSGNSIRFGLFDLPKNSSWEKVSSFIGGKEPLPNNNITKDELCVATGDTITYLNNKHCIIRTLRIQGPIPDLRKSLIIDKGILIVTNSNGHFAFQNGVPISALRFSEGAEKFMEDVLRKKAFNIANETGTFGIRDKRLFRFSIQNGIVDIINVLENLPVPSAELNTIKYDSISHYIFIGCATSGLFILRPTSFGTMQLKDTKERINNTVGDIILSHGTNDMIVTTQRFNIYTGNLQLFCPKKEKLARTNLFSSSDGRIFFQSGPLWMSVDRLAHTTAIYGAPITDVSYMEDTGRRVLFGFNGYLWEMKIGDTLRRLGSTGKDARLIFRYDQNTLWILTADGLFRYDTKTNKMGSTPIFGHNQIRSIFRAKDGSIWLGTYGKGFFAYNLGRFVPMPLDSKGALVSTHNFFEDEHGYFWMPTNNGLVQCLKSDLDAYLLDKTLLPYYYCYDEGDGLSTKEFNGGVPSPYVRDGNGILVYPTIHGVVFFNPLSIRPDIGASTILVENLLVDGKPLQKDNLSLTADFMQLIINISCPYYGNRDNMQLEYMLEGLGKSSWTNLYNNRQLMFNRLPKGNYRLVIRKRNGFGTNNFIYSNVTFEVRPFYYDTWWFRSLLGIALLLFIGALLQLYGRALTKRKDEMEEQVKARTRDLDISLERLNATIGELSISERKLSESNEWKEQAIAIILHDIKAPVNYLNIAASRFRNSIKALTTEELEEFSVTFADATQQTDKFVEELVQWLLVQNETYNPTASPFVLHDLLLEIKGLYNDLATWKGTRIEIDSPEPGLVISTDRNVLKLILRNLLDNAIKGCANGKITISGGSVDNGDSVQIVVADNGKGMDSEEIKSIMSSNLDQLRISKTSKMGYKLIKSFLRLIAGTLSINSALGKGTIVTLFLNKFQKQENA